MRSRYFACNSTPRSCASRSSIVTTPEDLSASSQAKSSRFFDFNKKQRVLEPEEVENRDRSGNGEIMEENCSICLDSLSRGSANIDSCNHQFCFDCIKRWSKVSNQCPLCKRKFTTIESENGFSKLAVQSPAQLDEADENEDEEADLHARYYSSGEETDLSGFLVADNVFDDDEIPAIRNRRLPTPVPLRSNRSRRRLVVSSSSESESDDVEEDL